MNAAELLNIRGSCCLKTAGIRQHLKELMSGNILKIVFDPPLRQDMENLVAEEKCEILHLDDEVVLLTPEKYSQYTMGLIKGVWGSTKEEVDSYIKEERDLWK